jgi:hypothetical protein
MKHAKRMVLVPDDVRDSSEYGNTRRRETEIVQREHGKLSEFEASKGRSNTYRSPKEKAPLFDADVIEHLPTTLRPKAATLLKRLKARPDVISWNEFGQVNVNGKEIPQ